MNFSLDTFSRAAYDYEQAQYQVLGGLKRVRSAFSQNQIYPHLGRLVKLHKTLRTIVQRSEDLKEGLPKEIKGIDLEKEKIIYEWPELSEGQMASVEELIEWALPRIQAAIEEGRTIYEFVEDNLRLEEVGLVPAYRQEGYLLVPDCGEGALHIIRYNLSIFTGEDERYRSLRTAHLKSIDFSGPLVPEPQSIKLELLQERRDLPNPATYFFDTDLSFPFEKTLFPVAKRKLMRHLSGTAGEA